MSVALPGGYVDTGYTGNLGGGGSVQFTNLNLNLSPASSAVLFTIIGTVRLGQWQIFLYGKIRNISTGPPPVNVFDLEVRAQPMPPGPGTTTVIYSASVNAAPGLWTSPVFAESDTIGPYRLGMLFVPPDPTTYPVWAKDCEGRFGWFQDFDTDHQINLTGAPSYTYPVSPTALPGDTPLGPFTQVGGWGFGGGCNFGAVPSDQIAFSNLQAGGVGLDTSGLDLTDGGNRLHGTVVTHIAAADGLPIANVSPSYIVRERVGVVDAAAGDFGATVLDADTNLLTTPVDRTTTHQISDWASGQPAFATLRFWLVQAAWCAAQNPAFASDDRSILWQLAPPRQFGGDYRFYPVALDVTSPLSVHRPDGGRPSDWVASGPGISVSETATETVITVTDPAGTVSRTLNTQFPARIGMSGFGAPFGFGEKEDQRHRPGEDVFSWGSYAYMDWQVAGVPGPLALRVDGSWYAISDDYNTSGASRQAAYSVTETQYAVSYGLTVREPPAAQRVDLNFPAAGAPAPGPPFYHGQARKLTLSGFQVGVYRIQKAELVATLAYLKAAWGKQLSRYDYSMLHEAVNGASPRLNWGDGYLKGPEVELPPGVGGPVRLANVIQSDSVGALDTQWSVEQLFDLVPGAEGMTRVWDAAAFDAACKDSFGNTVGPGLAQWVLAQFGTFWMVGTPYRPPCSVVCGSVQICNGVLFDLRAELTLGGALEALGEQDGARAGAGHVAGAYRADSGARVAMGTSDADGYVVVKPVRQINGTLDFYLAEIP